MKHILPLLSLSLFSIAHTADADPGYYVGTDAIVLLDDSEAGVAAQMGFEFESGSYFDDDSHSLEFEIMWVHFDETVSGIGLDSDVVPLMVNYKYSSSDISRNTPIYFYGGIGLGFSYVSLDVAGFGSDSDFVFSGQIFAGIGYRFSDRISLEIGYRNLYVDEISVFGVKSNDSNSNILDVGLTVKY